MTDELFVATDRLLIYPLTPDDDLFIFRLVNTDTWIRFIGNRNIASQSGANAYIQKILDNKNISYRVVKLKGSQERMGIITFIKRDYLEHNDIGFAFLPEFSGKGYAYEATHAVLHKLLLNQDLSQILAVTMPENIASIKLLKKLGLDFEKEMTVENQQVHLYGASAGKIKNIGTPYDAESLSKRNV
jgi:[ribosomal protein S5]-alanine N-acetyltransferase